MYQKLIKISKSILWLLGLVVLVAQTFRIVMFYIWGWDFEVNITRDGFVAVFGIALMFLQSPLKTTVKRVLNSVKNDVS